MRFGKGSGMLGLTALAVIASTFAQAQDTGWYAGANVGLTKSKIDNTRITNSLLGAGFASSSIDDQNKDIGFKVFAGYEFNRYFSLEGGYFNLGHFSYSATTVSPGTLNGDIRIQGLNFDPVLSLPFTEKFSGFVRAGVTYAQSKDAFNGAGAGLVHDPNPKKEAFGYKFGGGLQYDFTKSVGMRLEAERYRINDAVGNRGDIDMLSLGLLVRFGRQAPPPVQAAAGPEPVALAPAPVVAAPEPVLVVVPVAKKTQQYCTILDIQFNID